MTQLSLLAPAAEFPPHRERRTSYDAARKLMPSLTKREAEVLTALVSRGPSSPDELAAYMNVDRTVTRPRCSTMGIKGYVSVTGELRPTGLGGFAEVYRITVRGREFLREHAAAHEPKPRP